MHFTLDQAVKAVLVLFLCTAPMGCSSTTDENGLSLPSFGAPEQWEPDVKETMADSEKDL